jgi:hypothetical protein
MWLRAHSGSSALCWISFIHRRKNRFLVIRPGDRDDISSNLQEKIQFWSLPYSQDCSTRPVLCVLNEVRSVEWAAFGENSFRISTLEYGLLAGVFKAVINLRLLWNVRSFLTSSAAVNLSRRTFLLRIGWFQNCNFACCFAWVWILVAHLEGGT